MPEPIKNVAIKDTSQSEQPAYSTFAVGAEPENINIYKDTNGDYCDSDDANLDPTATRTLVETMNDIPFTVDIVPTEYSINPVSSGGVYQREKLLDDYKLDKTDTMPEPSEDFEGTPVIYVGATDSNYTKGYIYECQEVIPTTSPKTYTWVHIGATEITVDSAMSTTSENPVQNKVVNSAVSSAASTASTASTNATRALDIARSTSSFPTGDAYSSSSAYKVGDHVIYNNTLYRCKTACSANPWATNSANFEQTTLTKAVTDLNNDLSNKGSLVQLSSSIHTSTQNVPLSEDIDNFKAIVVLMTNSGIILTSNIYPVSMFKSAYTKRTLYFAGVSTSLVDVRYISNTKVDVSVEGDVYGLIFGIR